MSTFTDLVRSRRESGLSIGSSLGQSFREYVKEKIDPRRFLNQTGLLTALFPKLKAYEAKSVKNKVTKESLVNQDNFNSATLQDIKEDTQLFAKNSLVLPSMARDIFVMKENIAKIIKAKGKKPSTSAKEWMARQASREASYESKFGKKPIEEVVKNITKKSSWLSSLIGVAAVGGLSAFSGSASASINRTPGQYTGSDLTFNQLSREEQDKLLDAQFKQEGNKPGNLAARLNNPGAMKYTGSDWQKKYGATMGDKGFAKFPTLEQGRAAQRHLWEKSYGNIPITQAVSKWAPDAGPGYANALIQATGRPSYTSGGRESWLGSISGSFGESRPGHTHAGVDIRTFNYGVPVHAVESGVVTRVDGNDVGGYGNQIEIEHAGGYKTKYAHLGAMNVKPGQKINAGDVIGNVGRTGRTSGPHLHYEVMKDGRKINPELFNVSHKPIDLGPKLEPGTKQTAKTNEIVVTSPEVIAMAEIPIRDKDIIVQTNNVVEPPVNRGGGGSGDTRNTNLAFDFVVDRAVA